jgi:hypothetical protein
MLDQGAQISDPSFFSGAINFPELSHCEKVDSYELKVGLRTRTLLSLQRGGRQLAWTLIFKQFGSLHVLSSGSQSTFAMGIEVNRVDWGIVVVPGDEQRSSFHG